jgi:hypothetical protein
MSINDYLPRYEVLAAPRALLCEQDSQPPRHRHLINSRGGPPASGLAAAPPRTSAVNDTPLYWQTIQVMASRRQRSPGQQPR